jgi:hypothetical protein
VVLLSFILNLINRYHFFSKYCEDGFLFFLPTCGILALITRKHTVFFAWMQVLINQLVLPATNVEDCITSITEVKVKDLEQVAVTQKLVKKSLTPGSILVGHSLNHASAILKIDHKQVTVTGLLFHNSGSHTGPLPTIVNLCKDSRRKD